MKKQFTILAIFGLLFGVSTMRAQDYPGDPGTLVVDLTLIAVDQATGDSIPGQAPDGAGSYEKGQQVTITAKTIPGYTFKQWNDTVTANPRTVTMGNQSASYSAEYTHDKYTIKFIDADGQTLRETENYYGDSIDASEIKPIHEATQQYSYEFTGWNPELADMVTGSQDYYAVYDTITNKYTVTFYDWDETLLREDTLEFGAAIVYNGQDPVRNTVEGVKYTFKGWSPQLAEGMTVTGDMSFTAEYDEEEIEFTVTVILNGAGDPISQTFGANYGGEVTLQVADIPSDYHFISWENGSTDYPLTISVFSDTTYVGTIGSSFVDVNVAANKWNFFCLPYLTDDEWSQDKFNTSELEQVAWGTYDSELRASAQSGWVNAEEFEPMKGYIIWSSKAGRLRMSVYPENLQTGVVSVSLQEYPAAHQQNANWNFVGNPLYQSVSGANIQYEGKGEPSATIWDGTGYQNETLTDETFALQALQAFFIQVDSASRLTFGVNQNNPAPLRAQAQTPEDGRIDIHATAGGYTDKTRVIFKSNSSIKYEAGRDASKFITKTAPIQMYVLDVDNIECAQMVRPAGEDNIRLGYLLPKAGNIDIDMPMYADNYVLYDALTGRTYELNESISIYSEAGTYNSRLELRPVKRVVTAISNTTNETITRKVMLNGQLYLLRDSKIYNIQGQEVK